MQIQVFPALFLVRKRHILALSEFKSNKRVQDTQAHVWCPHQCSWKVWADHSSPDTHPPPTQSFLSIGFCHHPTPPHIHSWPVLHEATASSTWLIPYRQWRERDCSGNGEVGKSWVRAGQLQCYSKMTSAPACCCSWEPGTPAGTQESLRTSVLYRRATHCS